MGHIIEQIAIQRWHEIISVIDKGEWEITSDADVYIDFSTASAMQENMTNLSKNKVPVVIWTTWWLDDYNVFDTMFKDANTPAIWWGNFSLGVNLFWKALKSATEVFDKFKDYDVMVHEYHHKNKIDSPSWTAIQTGEVILKSSTTKNKIVTERLDRKIEDNELHVSSTRWWSIPWIHTATFDSDFDTIELTHTARTREGFALGSVIAAENINKFDSGLYNFSDVFDQIV